MHTSQVSLLLRTSLLLAVAISNLEASLIVHYGFGGNANDLSGNGHDATVFGAILAPDRFGTPNKAYSFDGINDFIGADATGLPTGARTVALFFNAASVASGPILMSYGGGSCGTSFFMGLNACPAIYNNSYYVSSHCDVNNLISPWVTAPVNTWQHFAITTDASGTRLYIDGVLRASNTNFIANTIVTGRHLSIGVATSPGGFAPYTDPNVTYFRGLLDEVRIYDTALSATEIAALAGVPEPGSGLLLACGLLIVAAERRRRF